MNKNSSTKTTKIFNKYQLDSSLDRAIWASNLPSVEYIIERTAKQAETDYVADYMKSCLSAGQGWGERCVEAQSLVKVVEFGLRLLMRGSGRMVNALVGLSELFEDLSVIEDRNGINYIQGE